MDDHTEAGISFGVPNNIGNNIAGPVAGTEQRNENILCAVLALMKELGEGELELVKRDIEKKIANIKMQ